MRIAKVMGTVVSTIKHPAYNGLKLYVVQPLNPEGQPDGDDYLAVDVVQSGVGDTVLVLTEGNGARQIFSKPVLPIRSVIVGVIDQVEVDDA
jgi:ethanolamine utilization protein EutN